MICPVCQKQMTEEDFGGIQVDVCRDGCEGIWFDWFELTKLDEICEGAGQFLAEALETNRENDENRGQINCPKCNIKMHVHKYQSSKAVNVDECYGCGGFFLDAGELKAIRDTFMSQEEEEAFAQKLIDGTPELEQAKRDLEKEKLRVEAIPSFTKIFRHR